MKARMRTYELLNAELVGLRGSEAPPSIDDAKKKIEEQISFDLGGILPSGMQLPF